MTLEEYIIKRKREDGINEFDLEKRMENTRICVNYIFEYFNNYLDTCPADEKTVLHEQKADRYRKMLSKYSQDVQDWLVSLYSSQGKYLHKHLMNLIDDDYFLLYDSEAEFRALSYEVYPRAVKKFKFLEGQSEMVFRFIKEAHRIRNSFHTYDDFYISDEINAWIYETYNKHISDPARKFAEAVEKLVEWNKTMKLDTVGIKAFEDAYKNQTYPGLGVVKKYSIMHHLQLMSRYLDEGQK